MLLYGSWQYDSDIIVYQYPNIWNSVFFIIFLVTYMNDYSYYRYILVFIKTLFIRCSSKFSSSQLFRSLFLIWGSHSFAAILLNYNIRSEKSYTFFSYAIHSNEFVVLFGYCKLIKYIKNFLLFCINVFSNENEHYNFIWNLQLIFLLTLKNL